jgi:hypothetical protein
MARVRTYPKSDPPTIFWTIGWARTGRMKSRESSVLVGRLVCVYDKVVW